MFLTLLLLTASVSGTWGQTSTDRSGIFYFVNRGSGKNGDPKIVDISDPANYFYLVPADNPRQDNKRDAWFSSDYSTANGDSEKPYLTTYKTNKDAADVPEGVTNRPYNSVWIVKFASTDSGTDYYYIIHAATGKYVVYEPPYSTKKNRKSMHLLTTDSPGENAKFAITTNSDYYNFRPKNVGTGADTNKYLNPTQQNYPAYYSSESNVDGAADYFRGLIGLWKNNGSDNADGTGSDWKLEATLLTAPTINFDPNTNTFSISYDKLPNGFTILFTIDGSNPTIEGATTSAYNGSPIPVTKSLTVKAVVARYGMVLTEMAEKELAPVPCATPVITYDNTTSKVSITSTTPSCTIYYTTDGSTPTTSSTPYSSSFVVGSQTTVKAIAIKSGFPDSEIASVKVVLNPTITIAENELTYNGSAIEPTVSVKDGETIIASSEYTVDYMNNTNAGTATVNIVDNPGGNYIVYGSTTFTINPAEVTLTANSGTETYDGTEKTVSGFTSSAGELIFAGVSASGSGTNVGTYDVTFTGVNIGTTMDTSGNCVVTNIVNGTLTISQKSIGDGEVAADDITISFVDNTSDEVEVEHGERPLTSDDYTVSFVDDGRGYQVATVTGIGNYTGSAKISRIKFSFFNSGSDDENVKNVATIAASMDIVTPDNMVAYIVTGLNVTKHEVKLTSIEYVPKDVPVLLLTDSPVEAYTATPKAVTTPADVSRNKLMILPPGKKVEASQVYMFHQGQFFLTTAGTLTKYKFCLENPYYELVSPVKPNPSNAPLRFVIEELTGIHEIQTAGIEGTSEDIWFSVDGLRLTGKPTRKGLYIKNGNKIVVK